MLYEMVLRIYQVSPLNLSCVLAKLIMKVASSTVAAAVPNRVDESEFYLSDGPGSDTDNEANREDVDDWLQ